MDEPMVDSESDEEETDDDDDVSDVVDAPNPSTYEVGGPSTAIATQPQVIDDLYREMDNLIERQGALMRMMVEAREQQWRLPVAEMHSREGTLMQYMLWMEERLTVLEKSLPGPSEGPIIVAHMLIVLFLCSNAEGAIELCRWFEKDGTYLLGIANADERSKSMFVVLTFKVEDELRNLRLRDHDIAAYTNRFNKLVLLCPEVVPSTKKKISQYIKGLPSYIQGETYSSKPTTLNEAIRMAPYYGAKVSGLEGMNAGINQEIIGRWKSKE
ncbi:hypothetical protein Tco_0084396 [Tanacetum coccineum]